ncbi:GTPase Era [Mycoplasma phocoenae]|uniref:GTPase Era n=1 Tax=Mycoplasma phocoenae TaxID=754517 RepID=A0A858U118_9MOLU|nr:GTPase Era [Mycoplasma phocoenae]QJG66794.1 GTPase Era [Mycoplasma phocoenae]
MKVCTIAIIGRPNVGKSTLLNKLIDYDLAIVTNVAQTTRDQIKGIYSDSKYQLIFTDTPGIHKAPSIFNERLNTAALNALDDADLILFLQPANEEIWRGDKFIIEKLKSYKNKIAVITKMDLSNREDAGIRANELKALGFQSVLGVGMNYDSTYTDLLNLIKHEYADKNDDSEPLYDPDYYTDVSMRFMVKETIREVAILNLREELPHSIAVTVDEFTEPGEGMPFTIKATIHVKRESQKGILVGTKGSMIKKISMNARQKLMAQFDNKIHLEVRVKVNKNWVDNPEQLKWLGY